MVLMTTKDAFTDAKGLLMDGIVHILQKEIQLVSLSVETAESLEMKHAMMGHR